MEKANEHHVPLHFNFVDFSGPFDTIGRVALWNMLRSIGVRQFVITYFVQFVPGVRHCRPGEFMQGGARYQPNQICRRDTTITSTVFEKLQLSTEEHQVACRKLGMKINFSEFEDGGRGRGEGGRDHHIMRKAHLQSYKTPLPQNLPQR